MLTLHYHEWEKLHQGQGSGESRLAPLLNGGCCCRALLYTPETEEALFMPAVYM